MGLTRTLGLAALFAAAPAAAQVTLNASTWVPPGHGLTAGMMMPWCADVEKATAGRVKCNLLPKAVAAPPQTFDAIKNGLADLSFGVHGYTPGRFPLTEAPEFPFMGDTATAISIAYQRVHSRMLAKHDEMKGIVALAVFTHGPGQIYNTKRPIDSVNDLLGMKVRVGGGAINEITQLLGAVPMLKPASESYEILSSGVADGIFFPKESPLAFKFVPVVKHMTIVPGGLYNVSFFFGMNPAAWAKISKADQAAILKLSGEAYARRAGNTWDDVDARGLKALQDAKADIRVASPQLIREIKERTDGIEQRWAERVKAKGVDGMAVLKALRAEIAALSKK